MTKPMSIENAVTGLMVVTPRLATIMIWMVFTAAHLAVLVLALFLLWWFQVSPTTMKAAGIHLSHSWPAATMLGMTAFLGLSGGGVLWAYARIWRWLLRKLLDAFLFS